eukprot:TRINITY_DN10628_c0_g1_i1.p1 TRINITY_DN10628_c0_g1~~TRINITY_DN10628_c0_g1_i1.p1  ORF type:complete len:167 (+),score=33.35 TRINITY_DN10628_c0_g1_i1:62-502(+)
MPKETCPKKALRIYTIIFISLLILCTLTVIGFFLYGNYDETKCRERAAREHPDSSPGYWCSYDMPNVYIIVGMMIMLIASIVLSVMLFVNIVLCVVACVNEENQRKKERERLSVIGGYGQEVWGQTQFIEVQNVQGNHWTPVYVQM